jgi:hypothetical protein
MQDVHGSSDPSTNDAFSHDACFERGEVAGNVRLGKYEAHYEEIFAEVIEDGIITTEERERLDRAADALGLDKTRLRKLEVALQAAYEARHHVKIRDLSEIAEAEPRPSLRVSPAFGTPETLALQKRIAELEGRVAELEKELAEARAHIPVEVDFSGIVPDGAVAATEVDVETLLKRVRHDPRDASLLHALYGHFTRAGELDRRFTVAQALVFLGEANAEQKDLFAANGLEGLIRPTTSLTQESWRRLLFHPEEELLVGEIFSVIVSAVLLGRVSALRRDKQLPTLDPKKRQDPAKSTIQAVRCFSWASAILGMPTPPVFADPEVDAEIELIPGLPPSTRIGRRALSGRAPRELAFLAGRHLAWYREERFVRLLVPTIPDLEDLFLAALLIGHPALPLSTDMRARVSPLAQAIEPMLEPLAIDRLRGAFLRFVEEGGRTNLQRWATASDFTACRAGLLLAGDLHAAHTMLSHEDESQARPRMDDLLVFVTSDRYAALRKQLGIALL